MDITKPKIDLREMPSTKCDSCEGEFFREVLILKKVSKILTGSSEDTLVPFPVYQCVNCSHVNEEFNPFTKVSDES
jgi:hypothetical protein